MSKKPPRKTAERILSTTLTLFNRFGVPNVSTTLISAELKISPGNLYYHYPAKDELINSLFEQFEQKLINKLYHVQIIKNIESAEKWIFELLHIIWQYIFIYRDLNDLLSKNRLLETGFKRLHQDKIECFTILLHNLKEDNIINIDLKLTPFIVQKMVFTLTYWLSYEYSLSPRTALESNEMPDSLKRGVQHILQSLIADYPNQINRHCDLNNVNYIKNQIENSF